jgi:hypothetical protein
MWRLPKSLNVLVTYPKDLGPANDENMSFVNFLVSKK